MLPLASRLSALAVGSVLLAACSTSNNATTPKDSGTSTVSCDPVDYASFDGQNPSVSFKNDVLPIQRRACAFSSCHGKVVGSKVNLYLGPNIADAAPDAATIPDIIANMKQASKTAPWLARVAPGDAQHSFLMLKLDACQDTALSISPPDGGAGEGGAIEAGADAGSTEGGATPCTVQEGALSNNACGDTMPRSGEQLSRQERDVFRRWILQGAQDN